MVNVQGLPYVIPDSMPPTGQESDEQTRAYTERAPAVGDSSSAAAWAKVGKRTIHGLWRLDFDVPDS
jgi:hypothetical protein